MKIFEINWESQGEKEWVAAETNLHALKVYCRITDMSIDDFEDTDEIIEIPKNKWSKYKIKMEGDVEITFKQYMRANNTPDIIAGTMYEV